MGIFQNIAKGNAKVGKQIGSRDTWRCNKCDRPSDSLLQTREGGLCNGCTAAGGYR